VRLLRAIPGSTTSRCRPTAHLLAELAAPLRAAGVDRLNVSLDSLDAERFRPHHAPRGPGARGRGHRAARAAGFTSIKLHTVALARLQRR
jgi:cyclic pyranopterin phosphate synthase